MSDANRAIAHRWIKEVWTDKLDSTIDSLMSADAVGHMEGGLVHGRAEFKQRRAAFLSAIPDLKVDIEQIAADGDNVIVRWLATGTHKGDGLEIPATNSAVKFRGMTWLVIDHGLIVKGWDTWNQGGLFEQLRTEHLRKSSSTH